MSFVDPSPRALENNSVTVIHVPASGQWLGSSYWFLSDYKCSVYFVSKIQGHFLKWATYSLCLHHHFHPWDILFFSLTYPSPNWPKFYTLLNSISDLDFCTPSEYTSAIHARDTLVLAKFLSENDLETNGNSKTLIHISQCKSKEIIYKNSPFLGSVRQIRVPQEYLRLLA